MLGSLICLIYFDWLENIDFPGHADDNTPFRYSSKIEHVVSNPQVLPKNYFTVF